MDDSLLEVEPLDLCELHPHVLALAEDVPQHGGDLSRGEDARGNLVEEGLEQVMVPAVDEGDIHATGA